MGSTARTGRRTQAGVPANATARIRRALKGTGVELVGSAGVDAYDARAPVAFRSAALLPEARRIVVAASAGPALWRAFRARMAERPALWDEEDPYDLYVAEQLDRANAALRAAGIPFVRFEAAYHAPLRVDFVVLARLVGLGEPGPFALLIHPIYGPWWALRGAWLVGADAEDAAADAERPERPEPAEPAEPADVEPEDVEPVVSPDPSPPCVGCPAPCVAGQPRDASTGIARATAAVRARCVVGAQWRYDDDQIAYHYDRAATRARLRASDR